MEAELLYRYPGAYKNFDDLEEHLTREEVIKMYDKAHEVVHQDRKFTAALKGIDIDEGTVNEEFDEIKRRAEAKVLGVSEEEIELDGLINIIDED